MLSPPRASGRSPDYFFAAFAGSSTSYVNPADDPDDHLFPRARKVRRVRRLGVHAASGQGFERFLIELLPVAEVPRALQHRGHAVVLVRVRLNGHVRRRAKREHVQTGLGRITLPDEGLDAGYA